MSDTPAPDHRTALHPLTQEVGHYENFPVASLLCPAHLRPAVTAIYHFARTADDIADEGDADAAERLARLARYRQALVQCTEAAGRGERWDSPDWPGVFGPLSLSMAQHRLPANLLHDLLSAFEQDARYTAEAICYPDEAALLGYCRLSANPIGRLLLHLYGIDDAPSLARSDAICSALQLINFWQDLSVDLPRGRHYLPEQLLQAHGLTQDDFRRAPGSARDAACALVVQRLCGQARALMLQGAPLVHRVPGRAGWELRLVVQGGLRILDHIAAIGHRSWQQRPKLSRSDVAVMSWRAMTMRPERR